MLSVNQITKSYGDKKILDSISFTLNKGERVALIGENGCGKTTLLSIITGVIPADSGQVVYSHATIRLGYVAQSLAFPKGATIADYLGSISGNVKQKSEQLATLAERLSIKPRETDVESEYDAVLRDLESSRDCGENAEALMPTFGLDDVSHDLLIQHLSGGQQTRLALLGVISRKPDLLVLDEPTNHLDIDMIQWLEKWLLSFTGGVLYTCHDRAFIDQTATGIIELDPDKKCVHAFTGNYSEYLNAKIAAREKQKKAFIRQQAEIKQLKKAIERRKGESRMRPGGKSDSGDKFAKGFFANRSTGTIRRAKQLEKRMDSLLNEGKAKRPEKSKELKVIFQNILRSGQVTVAFEDAAIGYPERTLIKDINRMIAYQDRIALMGANGSGKTTLLRTILGEIPVLDGKVRIGSNVNIGYMAQGQENLDPTSNALSTIRSSTAMSESDARTFLSYFLFSGDEVFTPVEKLSYGERSRLSLASFVSRGCNFLILDEPNNYLDIPSQIRFEKALMQFSGTVLAITHDRFLIEGFAKRIWKIDGGRIRDVN